MNFDWDSDNIGHIGRHNVRPEEAEDALLDRQKIGTPAYQVENEQRWAILGKANNGRILLIVFTRRKGLTKCQQKSLAFSDGMNADQHIDSEARYNEPIGR